MQIVLIGKDKINKLLLPKTINGDYWIVDDFSKKKIIKIMAGEFGQWELESNEYAKIISPNDIVVTEDNIEAKRIDNIVPVTTLKEDNIFLLTVGKSKEIYLLMCLGENAKYFTHLDITNTNDITVGCNQDCDIRYVNSFVSQIHIKLFRRGGIWYIQNKDRLYGTFVNDIPIYNNVIELKNGDTLYLMGLKIIIINNNLFVNNPEMRVSFSSKLSNLIISNDDNTNYNNSAKVNRNKNYYSKSPRIINTIQKEKIIIDSPPSDSINGRMTSIITAISTISMGLMTLTSFYSMIQGIKNGTAQKGEIVFSIIMMALMILSMIILPFISITTDKIYQKRNRKRIIKKYNEYLKKKKKQILRIKEKQKNILCENYLSPDECKELVVSENHRLWERNVEDKDFLTIRLGIGNVPAEIEIKEPEERFSTEDQSELMDKLIDLINSAQQIKEAPIVVSLMEKKLMAFIFKDLDFVDTYMKTIIFQIIVFHRYDDLKIVFLGDERTSKKWEFLKMLPHIWDNEKQLRFYGENENDYNDIVSYLNEELRNRLDEESYTKEEKKYYPHYLLITDCYQKIEYLKLVQDILKEKENIGFSFLCITDDLYQLPKQCTNFVTIDEEEGIIFENKNLSENQRHFELDSIDEIDFNELFRKISNIPIKIQEKSSNALLSKYSFLDMFDVGKVEQLNILNRWQKNDTTLSLKAPIGIDVNNRLIYLDAHEKFHGPHGLIAGATGSGKSEFIISYILSLSINYHPNDVSFVLIDYKGGGLALAFQKNNMKLPHLIGTITNIDKSELQRSLISIESEVKRRQIEFNKAREMTNGGTMDIYKYQKLYHEHVLKEPIPHLFIICDEFAELMQQQAEFMDSLISISRIGRSLGVHLILATQKPAGVVNDQIRSNSKFGVCLKVQDTSDSADVIGKPDAAYLRNPGQFYFKVGNDEYYILGQSGWAGEMYVPTEVNEKSEDNSVEFVSNTGAVIKRLDEIIKKESEKSNGDQLTNIVEYVTKLAKREFIKSKNLWLDNIPEKIYLDELKAKYSFEIEESKINVVIGEYDDPSTQTQGIVQIDLMKRDNLAIYGNAESGKEMLIRTLVFDSIKTYSSEQVQFYLLDFGSEALKIFKTSNHVGDVIFINESEKIENFFKFINKQIKERKDILSNYNGDYTFYISKGNKMPIIEIIINGYEAFMENYLKYEELIQTLTREGTKCGVVFTFVISTASSLGYRIKSNFNRKIALQFSSDDDYYMVFDRIGKKRPSKLLGRGLIALESNEIYEMQSARICQDNDYNSYILKTIEDINNNNPIIAPHIAVMPEVLYFNDVKEYITDLEKVPVGMIKSNLSICYYDFKNRFINIISSKKSSLVSEFIYSLLNVINEIKDTKVSIFDIDKESIEKDGDTKKLVDNLFKEIEENIKNKKEEKYLCVIIGIDKVLMSGLLDSMAFGELLNKANDSKKYNFIIAGSTNCIESCSLEIWYSTYVAGDNGIWIGSGGCEQRIISNDNLEMFGSENSCSNSFGLAVNDRNAKFIKLIGIEDNDNEI